MLFFGIRRTRVKILVLQVTSHDEVTQVMTMHIGETNANNHESTNQRNDSLLRLFLRRYIQHCCI
jgi:hypothetical protein